MTPTLRSNTPNFPTPPVKSFQSLSMPNDLVANKRNYYTEVFFLDYRSAAYGQGSIIANILNVGGGTVAGSIFGGITGALTGGIAGSRIGPTGAIAGTLTGGALGAFAGAALTGGFSQTSSIRLPIPRKINDTIVLNWSQESATKILGSALLGSGVSQQLQAAGSLAGSALGLAINPLLFLVFNNQNFREFTFQWELAPRTKKESETVKNIITTFKGASLPTKGIIMDYPLIAMVKMSPNDLDGLAIFQPMAITSVSANYTANPNPAFFEDTGAPTVVTLSVNFKEIKLWYRDAAGKPQM